MAESALANLAAPGRQDDLGQCCILEGFITDSFQAFGEMHGFQV